VNVHGVILTVLMIECFVEVCSMFLFHKHTNININRLLTYIGLHTNCYSTKEIRTREMVMVGGGVENTQDGTILL